MKSLKPTLMIAMLSGIFQGFALVSIGFTIAKQEPGFLLFSLFTVLAAGLFWVISYDRAVELRAWTSPETQKALLDTIPQDAIDRQWIKELETAYNTYVSIWPDANPLWQANMQIAQTDKDNKIRILISSAKNAKGVRLPKPVTARSDD